MPRALLFLLITAPAFAQNAPIPPKDAASKMTLPEGFKVTLFAGEPDVVQPIAFAFDDRGRLWVVECLSYPDWKRGDDRVLIFEDKDNDGHFDTKKVFLDRGKNLSGINLGYGGVWLCSTPNLIFVPDKNADDVPDGAPEILLDGWDLKAKHNVFNSLTWGPDGWLYGCNGISSNSLVGKPGTPDKDRVPLNCSVWRYHPTRKTFEVVFQGTTNPWGLDFDEHGQIFITNCVIKHAWQGIPGANYERMYGQPFNPHLYELMKSQADHQHWNGVEAWSDIRSLGVTPTTDSAGGGHAHCGGMIYLGTNWPAEYRNNLFTCNIHGNRINRDRLEVKGSSYVIKHEKDFLFGNDSWFRGVALGYGPDGGVYVADWSDTGECHDYEDIHRENGRIYKITYGSPPANPINLAGLDDLSLVRLIQGENQWMIRHARRLIAERAAVAKPDAAGGVDPAKLSLARALMELTVPARPELRSDEVTMLNMLWTAYVTGLLPRDGFADVAGERSEWMRAWSIRLLVDDVATEPLGPKPLAKLASLAKGERSPIVRMSLTSALQKIPVVDRWPIAEALAAHAEDASDPYLPLMLWYAVEPMVASDPGRALALAASAKIPLVRQYIARRYLPVAGLGNLARQIAASSDPAVQSDILAGAIQGLTGRTMTAPPSWAASYATLMKSPNPEVRHRANRLALLLRDPAAIAATRSLAADPSASTDDRLAAIDGLVAIRAKDLATLLHPLLADRSVRAAALRALASTDHPETAVRILDAYPSLDPPEKADALATLAARPASALTMMRAIASEAIPKTDVTPSTLQALAAINDGRVKSAVARIWASVRPSPAEKRSRIEGLKTELTSATLAKADPSRGRAVFARACASCHTLFDAGGKIGPELTGSQRTNLDYVLTHIVDPSSVVGSAFQVQVFATSDGRVLSGIVKAEDENAFTIQTANDVVLVPKRELEARRSTGQSLMPDGLLDGLNKDEVRDLIGYLASPSQVPLPVGPAGRP